VKELRGTFDSEFDIKKDILNKEECDQIIKLCDLQHKPLPDRDFKLHIKITELTKIIGVEKSKCLE